MFRQTGSIVKLVYPPILCFCVCARCSFFSLPSTSKLLWLCSGNPISLQRWASMLSSNTIRQNHWQHAGPEKHFQRQRKTKEMGSHWLIVGAELGKEHLEPLKDPLTLSRRKLWMDRMCQPLHSQKCCFLHVLKYYRYNILQAEKQHLGLWDQFCLSFTAESNSATLFQYFPIIFPRE